MIFKPWQKYKIRKAQEANSPLRKSGSYSKADKIGIIFFNNEHLRIEEAEKLGTLIKMDGKTVKTIAYEHKSSVKHLPYETFTKANFDFWGRFVGKPIEDFVSTDFDFLVCLDVEPNIYIRSVLANSQARCRIGRYNLENQYTFEMLYDNKKSGSEWVENLYQYIKKLS